LKGWGGVFFHPPHHIRVVNTYEAKKPRFLPLFQVPIDVSTLDADY
jgi:hypothetical protein